MTSAITEDNTSLSEQYILYPSGYEGRGANLFEEKRLVYYNMIGEDATPTEKVNALEKYSSIDPVIQDVAIEYMWKALILKRVHDAGLMDRYVARYNLQSFSDIRSISAKAPETHLDDLRPLTAHYNHTSNIINYYMKEDSELWPIIQGIKDDMDNNKAILCDEIKNQISIIHEKIKLDDPKRAKRFGHNWYFVSEYSLKNPEYKKLVNNMYQVLSVAMTFRDEIVTNTRTIDNQLSIELVGAGIEAVLTLPDRKMAASLFPTLINTAMTLGALGINPTDSFKGIDLIKSIYKQPLMIPVIHQAAESLKKTDELTAALKSQVESEVIEKRQRLEAEKKAEIEKSIRDRQDYIEKLNRRKKIQKVKRIALIAGGILAADQLMFDGAMLDKVIKSVPIPSLHSSVQVENIDQAYTSAFESFSNKLDIDINSMVFDPMKGVESVSEEISFVKHAHNTERLKDVISEIRSNERSIDLSYDDPSQEMS